jgi:hypothetical protein
MTSDSYKAFGVGANDPKNPQSWNRYSYAISEPVNMLDPTGQVPCGGQTSQSGSVITVDVYDCVGLLQPILPGFASPMSPFENMGSAIQAGENAGLSPLTQFMQALQAAQAKTCRGLPDGMVLSVSAGGGLGPVGVSGSGEVVFNFNSGEVSVFGALTKQGGYLFPTGLSATASLQGGFIWGLGQSNTSYQGPFTSISVGAGIIAATLAASSNGIQNPFNLSTPITAAVGAQTPGASFAYGLASYSDAIDIGSLSSTLFQAMFPEMAQYMKDYQSACGK